MFHDSYIVISCFNRSLRRRSARPVPWRSLRCRIVLIGSHVHTGQAAVLCVERVPRVGPHLSGILSHETFTCMLCDNGVGECHVRILRLHEAASHDEGVALVAGACCGGERDERVEVCLLSEEVCLLLDRLSDEAARKDSARVDLEGACPAELGVDQHLVL